MAEAAPAKGIQARYEHALQTLGAAQLPSEALQMCYAFSPASASPVDLAQCEFYADFAASPAEANAQRAAALGQAKKKHGVAHVQTILSSSKHHEWKKERRFDFRLQEHETQRLAQHGVVVSQRMSAESFAEVYYQLYTDDMPVYVTADSLLHAWHRSFDAALVDIETQECIPVLDKILKKVSAKCHELYNAIEATGEATRAKEVLLDVDLFLSVAVSLLWGEESFGLPGNDARVSALWKSIRGLGMTHTTLFGANREIDFSLFKPRGHYTKSQELKKYFQAVTWLGTIDFRIAGGDEVKPANDLHQLQCAVVLVGLLRESHRMSRLSVLDELISSLVGDGDIGADSLTPMQLDKLLPASLSAGDVLQTYVGDGGVDGLFPPALLELQVEIVAKGLGVQLISGHPHVESASSLVTGKPTVLPTSFAFFGQRFVWSAFIFSRIVYDQIIDQKTKVVRRMPSAVDVAFSLLGNDAAGAIAAQRMSMSSSNQTKRDEAEFVPLRDGIPYASNLIALRETIDSEFGEAVDMKSDESISTLWVRALRELSKPSANRASVFQSKTWQLRQLNAQLASFTQLRHDSVLYAKQSYTMGTRCEYAAGFVDPYPLFYAKMGQMATRMAEIIQNLQSPAEDSALKNRGAYHFAAFAETMKTLEEIAVCQANKQPLSEEQTDFVKTVMEERFGSGGTKYAGWYPKLFYTKREDSGKRDVLVVDVHTDVPSVEHNDPGGVLHLGTGDVLFGFFVVDNVLYSGPVFSSYEFVTSINERLTDDEFKAQIDSQKTGGKTLSPPDWALASYLC